MIGIKAADRKPWRIAPSRPDRVWNRIPEAIRSQIVDLALDQPELSPRELAVRFTDEEKYFVSEASVYRLLKAHDLITSFRLTSSSKRPIERWHQTLKNRILLEHYYLPGDLERQVAAFVAHYNHARYHESLDNLTPADVFFGRAEAILLERERIKRQTIANRRLQHQLHAA